MYRPTLTFVISTGRMNSVNFFDCWQIKHGKIYNVNKLFLERRRTGNVEVRVLSLCTTSLPLVVFFFTFLIFI